MSDPTLDEALAAAGFTHREPRTPAGTYQREIVDASGAVVAVLTAHAAWAWLRDRDRSERSANGSE